MYLLAAMGMNRVQEIPSNHFRRLRFVVARSQQVVVPCVLSLWKPACKHETCLPCWLHFCTDSLNADDAEQEKKLSHHVEFKEDHIKVKNVSVADVLQAYPMLMT